MEENKWELNQIEIASMKINTVWNIAVKWNWYHIYVKKMLSAG